MSELTIWEDASSDASSILLSVKKSLGISSDCSDFDTDLIMDINSVFAILYQMGVGPSTPFSIVGSEEVWNDFILDVVGIESVKTYMYQKVKIIFDPPTSSAVLDALKSNIAEFEWRLNTMVDKFIVSE